MREVAYRGALVVGCGHGIRQFLALLRNVLIARLVSEEDWGIAATFLMTVALLEMISNLSVDALLVQDPEGDKASLQSSIHAFQLIRGCVNAVILIMAAGPIAYLFGVPEVAWAFRMLAIVPLLRGFAHLDLVRATRQLSFKRLVTVQVSSEALVVLAAWPLGSWLGNYSALLWLLVGREFLLMAGSHLLSTRRYSLTVDIPGIKLIFSFGWPLMLNGVLLFCAQQGDRLIIGSAKRLLAGARTDIVDLGMYTIAVSLTMVPAIMLARVCGAIMLPILSRTQENPGRFASMFRRGMQTYGLLAGLLSMVLILNGHWIIPVVFGEQYLPAVPVIGWVGAIYALNILRAGINCGSIALGDTRTPLVASLARTSGVLGALAMAGTGHGLVHIAAAGCIGEGIALLTASRRMHRIQVLPWSTMLAPAGMVAATMAVAAILARDWNPSRVPSYSVLLTAALAGILLLSMLCLFREFRDEGRRIYLEVTRRLTGKDRQRPSDSKSGNPSDD